MKVKFLTIGETVDSEQQAMTSGAELSAEGYTHAVILPKGADKSAEYEEIISVYLKEDAVMLPLVLLKSEKATGVLNTCIWNANLTGAMGELDHELSLKQIDLTLYGALIPTKYLVSDNYNSDIKFYNHNYFLNKITKDEVSVVGIPKILATTEVDLTFADVSNEEKVKFFNQAKEV